MKSYYDNKYMLIMIKIKGLIKLNDSLKVAIYILKLIHNAVPGRIIISILKISAEKILLSFFCISNTIYCDMD